MTTLLLELSAYGDVVVVDVGSVTFIGSLVVVGTDYVVVSTAEGTVDLALAAVVMHVTGHRAEGARASREPPSLRARLLERETDGRPVEIGVGGVPMLTGALAVGRDHVLVASDDENHVVAIAAIQWVRTAAR